VPKNTYRISKGGLLHRKMKKNTGARLGDMENPAPSAETAGTKHQTHSFFSLVHAP